jgi:hypothetical protein
VFMEFQDGGGLLEVLGAAGEAVGLDFAEVIEGLLELSGEARAVEADGGEAVAEGVARRAGLPSSVLGPVECSAFARLTAARLIEARLRTGRADMRVILSRMG